MTRDIIDRKYQELIRSYIQIRPVLADVYKRSGNQYVDGILNEIRAINDHMARCYLALSLDSVEEELCKAEGHLKRLIYDCFKQLNIIFFDYVNEYELLNFGPHWICLNGGNFWESYTSMRKQIGKYVEDAKNEENKNYKRSFSYYQEAYVLQGEVYNLLDQHKEQLYLSKKRYYWRKINSLKGWLLTTSSLAIIPALIWEAFIHRCYIWACVSEWLLNTLRLLGVQLQAL